MPVFKTFNPDKNAIFHSPIILMSRVNGKSFIYFRMHITSYRSPNFRFGTAFKFIGAVLPLRNSK
jgi:hypothetical protein